MPTPKELREKENERMTKKQKRKQIFRMIMAALLVGGIFLLGYVLIFAVGIFFFS